VGGIDDGSAAVFIVISGSKERLYWEGSGKGMEIIGGIIVEPEGFELTAWPRAGGGTNSPSGSSVALSVYCGGGTW